MRFSTLAIAAAASTVSAQRPMDTPVCDYYTKALLKDNTAENQATLLTLLVNTVVIGNCMLKTLDLHLLHPANLFDDRHHAQRWRLRCRYPRPR